MVDHKGTLEGRWSRKFDACTQCGTTETPHGSKGLCRNCYMTNRRESLRPVPEAQTPAKG